MDHGMPTPGKSNASNSTGNRADSLRPSLLGWASAVLCYAVIGIGGGMAVFDAAGDVNERLATAAGLWLAFYGLSLVVLAAYVHQQRRARQSARAAQSAEHRLFSYGQVLEAAAQGEAAADVFIGISRQMAEELDGGGLRYINLVESPDPAYLPGLAWLGRLLQQDGVCKKLATGRLLAYQAITDIAADQPDLLPCHLQAVLGRQGTLLAVMIWESDTAPRPAQEALLASYAQLFGLLHELERCQQEISEVQSVILANAGQVYPSSGKTSKPLPQSIAGVNLKAGDHWGQDAGLADVRLLLVEDNRINQQIAKELLKKVGVQVEVANNGREAVEKLAAAPALYQVVLMDLQMPEMDGMEATRVIRADPRFKSLPILAMTAHAMADVREQCLSVGMNDHIVKPIDPECLYRTLSKWLKGTVRGQRTGSRVVARQPVEKLPVLPGVNVADGVRRMGGSLTVYLSILQKFSANQQKVVLAIRSALARNDVESTVRQLHTLKGILGSLGAEALQNKAKDIETRLVEKQYSQIETWLVELERELAALFAAIQEVLAGPFGGGFDQAPSSQVESIADEASVSSPLNMQALLPLVNKAMEQLDEFDVDSEKTLVQIRRLLHGRTAALRALDKVDRCLKDYDYEKGLAELTAWADNLQADVAAKRNN